MLALGAARRPYGRQSSAASARFVGRIYCYKRVLTLDIAKNWRYTLHGHTPAKAGV